MASAASGRKTGDGATSDVCNLCTRKVSTYSWAVDSRGLLEYLYGGSPFIVDWIEANGARITKWCVCDDCHDFVLRFKRSSDKQAVAEDFVSQQCAVTLGESVDPLKMAGAKELTEASYDMFGSYFIAKALCSFLLLLLPRFSTFSPLSVNHL